MVDPPSIDPKRVEQQRLGLLRSICAESFRDFHDLAWHVTEPTREQLPSHAVDAVCAALQAVADGRIKRLAISMPPGVGKSAMGAVDFPAWLLLKTGGRARVMVGSYSWNFATRDSSRCRDLVQSEWYQSLLDDAWQIREDANHKDDWWTSETGRRLIASVGGKALGERCTFQIIDDALSGADVHSPTAKLEAIRWVNEVLPSRLEDQRVDPRVIIGQRLDVDDPISEALKRGWKYLCLPAVLSWNGVTSEPCELLDDNGELVWRDPRGPDEPLVALLDMAALRRLEIDLGPTTFATQYLQRPSNDSAATFKRTSWRFYRPSPSVPGDAPRPAGCDTTLPAVEMPASFDRKVITADLTFGAIDGDFAVVSAWGSSGPDRYLVPDQWREQAGFDASLAALDQMAQRHPDAKVCIEKAANGWAVIEKISAVIPGVAALRPIGTKKQRHAAASPTCASGNCYLPLGWPGLTEFVEELAGATKHDDQTDTASYAIIELNGSRVAAPQGAHGGFVADAAPSPTDPAPSPVPSSIYALIGS